MRAFAICLVVTAAMTAGCLRATAFKCASDTECGTAGVCEANGYCSVPNAKCTGTGLLVTAAMTAGCLRATAFKCASDTECGTAGVCEANGYCSVPNAKCTGTG